MVLRIGRADIGEGRDRRLVTFIVGYFILQALNIYVKLILGSFAAWDYLSKGILAVLLIRAIMSLSQKSILKALFAEMCVFFLFLFTYLMGTYDSGNFSSIVFNSLAVYLPLGICAYNIVEKDKLLNALYYSSWIIQIIILLVMFGFSSSYKASYLTSGSYILSLQFCFMIDHYLSKRKIRDILFSSIDVLIIIAAGSRGPLVCIASYIIIRVAFANTISRWKKYLLITLIGVVVLLILTYNLSIASYLMSLSARFGFSSRSLRMLLSNELTADSGRGSIAEYYIGLIKQRPFFGYGLAGGWSPERGYPHNIFIELMLSFGVFLGALAAAFYIWIVYKGIICRNTTLQRLTHIFIADTVCLLFSGSFIMWSTFFICMAFCLTKSTGLKDERTGDVSTV